MQLDHLFYIAISQFVRAYGELKGCGSLAAKHYSGHRYNVKHVFRYLSYENKHSYVDTMARIDRHSINPIRVMRSVGVRRANIDQHGVDTTRFLLVKWHKLHEQIITRFRNVLNDIGTNLQIPALERGLDGVDYDPAVLAHALLSHARLFRGYDETLRTVPAEVINLLGFSTKSHRRGRPQ